MKTKELLSIPFLLNGRTTEGLDCWGLVLHYWKGQGVILPDTPPIADDWADFADLAGAYLRQFEDCLERIPAKKTKPGDIICWDWSRHGIVDHVGLVVSRSQAISAFECAGIRLFNRTKYDHLVVSYHRPTPAARSPQYTAALGQLVAPEEALKEEALA